MTHSVPHIFTSEQNPQLTLGLFSFLVLVVFWFFFTDGELAALLQLEYTQGHDSLQNKEEKKTPQKST